MQQEEGFDCERKVRRKKGIKKRKKEAVLTVTIAIQIQYSFIFFFCFPLFNVLFYSDTQCCYILLCVCLKSVKLI